MDRSPPAWNKGLSPLTAATLRICVEDPKCGLVSSPAGLAKFGVLALGRGP